MRLFNYFYYLCLALCTGSCHSLKTPVRPNLKQIPAVYGWNNDTLSSATLSWRNYFADSILTDLVDYGLRNNPDLNIALQKIEIAGAGVVRERGRLFPQLSGNSAYLQRKFGLYTMDGAGNISTDITPGKIVPIDLPDYYVGLQTSWEIDIWGRLRNRKRAAFARLLSSFEGMNLVTTNLVAQIAHAYYSLVMLDNELDVIRETITLQTQAVDLVMVQKEAAVVNGLAVEQFRAQLLNSQSMEQEVLQDITAYENKLNLLLGRYPQPVTRVKISSDFRLPALQTGLPAQLLIYRPDIRRAEQELLATNADVKAARAAFYPSFSLSGSTGFQAFKPGLLFQFPQSLAYSLLGNVMAPLLNRSSIKANFKTSNAAQVEALYVYQRNLLTAYSEVNTEFIKIGRLEKIIRLKTEQMDANNRSAEIASDLFKTSDASYVEVLMAQRLALETKLLLMNAKRRQLNASIDLYKALGGGWR